MDVMNIKSKMLTGWISGLLKSVLSKKIGHEIDVKINEVGADFDDARAHVHLDIDLVMSKDELYDFLWETTKR